MHFVLHFDVPYCCWHSGQLLSSVSSQILEPHRLICVCCLPIELNHIVSELIVLPYILPTNEASFLKIGRYEPSLSPAFALAIVASLRLTFALLEFSERMLRLACDIVSNDQNLYVSLYRLSGFYRRMRGTRRFRDMRLLWSNDTLNMHFVVGLYKPTRMYFRLTNTNAAAGLYYNSVPVKHAIAVNKWLESRITQIRAVHFDIQIGGHLGLSRKTCVRRFERFLRTTRRV